MKKQIVLIHMVDGLPMIYSSDPSIIVVLHDRDSQGDQEAFDAYQENDPAFDALAEQCRDAEIYTPIEAKQALDSPAFVDWNAEATRLGEMREKAIAYLTSTAKGNDDDIEFITSNGRGAVLYDTTDGFVLIQVGTDGPFYVSDMYEMDNLLSTCACVQKAIAERTELDSPPDGPEADHRSQYLGDGFTDQVYERLAEEESLDEEAERGTKP